MNLHHDNFIISLAELNAQLKFLFQDKVELVQEIDSKPKTRQTKQTEVPRIKKDIPDIKTLLPVSYCYYAILTEV